MASLQQPWLFCKVASWSLPSHRFLFVAKQFRHGNGSFPQNPPKYNQNIDYKEMIEGYFMQHGFGFPPFIEYKGAVWLAKVIDTCRNRSKQHHTKLSARNLLQG